MKPEIELLAPGGDLDSIKAAIAAGADAVYCGLNQFNARNRAANLEFEELKGVIYLAHDHDCRVFLTLNILIMGSEFPALVRLLNKLVNTPLDGVIVQDLGLFYLLSEYYPSLDVHASTQMNTHNDGQIKFLNRLKPPPPYQHGQGSLKYAHPHSSQRSFQIRNIHECRGYRLGHR